jgi:hypothetical protein
MNEATELVVVRTFTNVPDAHVARSALDAAGIPTQLADENFVAANWLYSNAVGGVKLLVPSDRLDEASALLQAGSDAVGASRVERFDEPHETACENVCRCGGTDFELVTRGRRWAALTWLLAGIPLAPIRRTHRCRRCGATLETRGGDPG